MLNKNKKFIIILISAVIIIVAGLIFYYFSGSSSLPPTLSLSEEEWDFGKIKEDERPVHIFTLSNTGREELIIERVRASCGCTATMLSSDHLPPGGSSELKVTFNPTGYSGLVKKDIYIESNDPASPQKKLTIIAEVEPIPSPQAFFSNSQWELGLISQGEKPTFNFIIENKGELDLVIEKIDASEYVKYEVEVPLNILPGEKREIIFTYDSTLHEVGSVRESVRLYCNDPKRKALSLRIEGYIQEKPAPALGISPVEMSFNLVSNAESSQEEEVIKKISLTNSGEEKLKIASIKASADYLIPLSSELELNPGEEEEIVVRLEKDKISNQESGIEERGYLYLTIALPVIISR